MSYLPIGAHGLIGDMRTAALVDKEGRISWMCWPDFDSPSIFASLLDHEKGGSFRLAPVQNGINSRQMYWPETNVLITRFYSDEGLAEVTDYMPVGEASEEQDDFRLIRRVEVIRGRLTFRMRCDPAFDYARGDHDIHVTENGAVFENSDLTLGLSSTCPLEKDGGAATTTITLSAGERADFALGEVEGEGPPPISPLAEEKMRNQTVSYWRRWVNKCTYEGRWREAVHRSALALKLLTYEPTGAIVAAPTTSLPEHPGGVRNWDYRYTWIRDAAFTVYGFMRIGFTEEAAQFLNWLRSRCIHSPDDGYLHVVYSIHGEAEIPEEKLNHLEGYKQSSPVRIGNAAKDQLQLDIYGELMDAVYLANKYHAPISYDYWQTLRRYVNWVCENCKRPDAGVWEVRTEPKHFVYSKLMCWVAIDRALRLADRRSFPAPVSEWRACRDAIYQDIMEHGWSDERQAFTQHYDTDELDAANLIMPLVFFASPNDPRMLKTIDAIMEPPSEGGLRFDSLVYRYNTSRVDDGLSGPEGTFNMSTFWLVEALTRAGRTDKKRLHEAQLIFEKMLGYSNELGLYAEETGSHGQALGNFPQAFTHLALISSAFNLDRTLEGELYGKIG